MILNAINCVIAIVTVFANYFDFHADMDCNMLRKHRIGLGGGMPDIFL
jgi:hypothetical protein